MILLLYYYYYTSNIILGSTYYLLHTNFVVSFCMLLLYLDTRDTKVNKIPLVATKFIPTNNNQLEIDTVSSVEKDEKDIVDVRLLNDISNNTDDLLYLQSPKIGDLNRHTGGMFLSEIKREGENSQNEKYTPKYTPNYTPNYCINTSPITPATPAFVAIRSSKLNLHHDMMMMGMSSNNNQDNKNDESMKSKSMLLMDKMDSNKSHSLLFNQYKEDNGLILNSNTPSIESNISNNSVHTVTVSEDNHLSERSRRSGQNGK